MKEVEEDPNKKEKRIKTRNYEITRPGLEGFAGQFKRWLSSDDISRFGQKHHTLAPPTVDGIVSNFRSICAWIEVRFFLFNE
jgi:hypothetical protein